MIGSIYDNPLGWQNNKNYDQFDVILEGGYYYYALDNHTSGAATTFAMEKDQRWGGLTSRYGKTKPLFIWAPNYTLNISHKPRIKSIQYGNGFEQVAPDGIHNNLIVLRLAFDKKSYNEFAAITHFLNVRNGVESFGFVPPAPYNVLKLFRCKEWDGNMNFIENHSVVVNFEEVLV